MSLQNWNVKGLLPHSIILLQIIFFKGSNSFFVFFVFDISIVAGGGI